jgi:predicted cation transporter
MWVDRLAIRGQTTSEPPTIDLGPILLFVVVAAIAYVVVSHIKEILIFLLMVAIVLMLLGGFYVVEIFQTAFETPPKVTETVEPRAPPPSSEVY